MTPTSVDVVVPAYNEQDHIAACIAGVLAQDYPPDRLRLLLVDAGSSDDTVEIAQRHAAEDERIVVVSGEGRLTTPEALNVGLRVSTADVFARVDAHGCPAQDYISRAVAALEESDERVVGVGGQPNYSGASPFERAFTLARGSRLGVGGSVYAAPGQREIVDTVPWGIYRRPALEEVGGFDPAMNHGEDEELNWRLKQAGMSVMLDSSIRFEYVPRATLGAAFRQYRNYGRARARVVAAHPDFLRPRHAAPAAFVLGLAGLAALSPFSTAARAGLAAAVGGYAVAAGAGAVAATGREEIRLAPRVAACFPALHFGYGVGTIGGFASELKVHALGSRYQSLSCRSQ
ncbi:MAG TPA: glycosyltransferase family 2 protein [Solirubrobacterales bacterium]|nr:glycosyltransferase family 2 protein [Solirubrobacterales bacterium]